MAQVISPKTNIPCPGTERNGVLNKTQVMRDLLKARPKITKEEAIAHMMNLRYPYTPTSNAHASTLYRNVMEENRKITEESEILHSSVSLDVNTSDKNLSNGNKISEATSNISSDPININESEVESQEQPFDQFLLQFKTLCQNPYARKLAKACIEVVEENESRIKAKKATG